MRDSIGELALRLALVAVVVATGPRDLGNIVLWVAVFWWVQHLLRRGGILKTPASDRDSLTGIMPR